ncbi:protein phosphatase 2C domain-containing protein [Streptomyces sp. URMC 129]|uniref:protein phosphatase 2C domain-containing protein n=1 Tax=Streptomyces sp. URMC 129 TaxID=3423407 RepID=UPI003F1B4397
MPQLDQLSACPGCGEPLEDDDRFCGVCGRDLRAAGRRTPPPASGAAAPAPPPRSYTPTEHDFTLPPPATGHEAEPGTGPGAESAPRPEPRPEPESGPAPAPAPAPAGIPPMPTTPPRVPAADPRAVDPRAPLAAADPRAAAPTRCAVCGNGQVAEDGYCTECGRPQPGERDHVERALGGVAAVSDLGLRHHRNEDAFTVSATALSDGSPAVIAVVCDGVSSSSRPDEASAAAAEAAQEFLLDALPRGVDSRRAMHEALVAAAGAVSALADPAEQEPGRNAPACTIVSAITAGRTLTIGWIGDSRAYWVPEEEGAAPARLTQDDSWAAQMVAAGLLSEAEAMNDHRAHAITAWLGADAQEIEPHTRSFEPDRPGVVIVCTDGLWNYAETAEEMARVVPAKARSAPLAGARHLVRHALDSGGHDNVTVAVIPFPAEADRSGSA